MVTASPDPLEDIRARLERLEAEQRAWKRWRRRLVRWSCAVARTVLAPAAAGIGLIVLLKILQLVHETVHSLLKTLGGTP